MDESCSTHGKDEKRIHNFSLKPGGKGPTGRSRRKREDDVRMYLNEVRWEVVDGVHLAK